MQYVAAVEQSIPTCQSADVRPWSKNSALSKVGKASVVAAAGHVVVAAAAEDVHLKCYYQQSTWLALLVQERSRKRFREDTADA